MRIPIFLLGVSLLVNLLTGGCESGSQPASLEARKIAWVNKGKEAVQQKLKDPSSADFRNVFFHQGTTSMPMTCGEVNAKNSFDGKGRFQRFISAGKVSLTFLEEEVEGDFGQVWRKDCE